jgi:hypothetical protein
MDEARSNLCCIVFHTEETVPRLTGAEHRPLAGHKPFRPMKTVSASPEACCPFTILPPMSDLPEETSLLAELDRRQNDVLRQLDDLNDRVERLLEECLAARNADDRLDELRIRPAA